MEKALQAKQQRERERIAALFKPVSVTPIEIEDPAARRKREWRELFLDVEAGQSRVVVLGRAAFLVALVFWGLPFVFHPLDADRIMSSPAHSVHLVFHEAGHPLFSVLGSFMGVLGGSLMQVLVPSIVAGAFLRQRDQFGAAFGAMWCGHALIDVAPYVADARALVLPLLGGGTGQEVEGHDWEYILTATGLLKWDVGLGRAAHWAGSFIAITAALYAAFIVGKQWSSRIAPQSSSALR